MGKIGKYWGILGKIGKNWGNNGEILGEMGE